MTIQPSAPRATQAIVNWPRLTNHLDRAGLDALLVASPASVTYLSDYWSLSHWSRPASARVFALAVNNAARDVHVVTPLGNSDLIAPGTTAPPTSVRPFGTFYVDNSMTKDELDQESATFAGLIAGNVASSAADALTQLIDDLGLSTARIGVESGPVDLETRAAIGERHKHLSWHSASNVIRAVRAIKTPTEIDRLQRAAQVTDTAWQTAIATGASTEQELNRTYLRELVGHGALPVNTSITSGPRTALPNGQATNRPLSGGDLLRFDGGGRIDHYVADIARSAAVDVPTAAQRDRYQALYEGLEAMIAAATPGMSCAELFELGVAAVRRSGLPGYRRQHCGHGIGIENYDAPSIAPGSDDVLEPGMVICLETPHYELGWGGVQVEDTMVITDTGVERFTQVAASMPQLGTQS